MTDEEKLDHATEELKKILRALDVCCTETNSKMTVQGMDTAFVHLAKGIDVLAGALTGLLLELGGTPETRDKLNGKDPTDGGV